MYKTLIIGIAPYEEIKKRTIAIAKGKYKPHKNEPKVWFTSMESLAQVLSSKNKLLLEIIRSNKPKSMSELAELSGRHKSNLSRTLKTLARYGLIELDKNEKGLIQPRMKYQHIQVDFEIKRLAS